MSKRIVGYGICGKGEASRYMEATLKEFQRLCDETIILLNNVGQEEVDLIAKYGFKTVTDNREWGKNQNKIKEDFLINHVDKLNPDITVCLDMDEVFANVTRETILKEIEKSYALYVYIVNLWNDGWRKDWSFSNVRIWSWQLKDELDTFFKFETRPLHCGLAPKWCYAINYQSPFVLEHYGLKEKKDRMRKVERYEKYDPNQIYRHHSYYDSLKTDEFEEYNRDEVVEWVETETDKIPQPVSKKPLSANKTKMKKVLILREADGLVFDVKESESKHYLKQKFKGKGFRLVDLAPTIQKKNPKVSDKTLLYVANHHNRGVDDTEGHISRAFEELGWQVIKASESDTEFPDADVMFYHKFMPPKEYSGKKVCWYFDKVDFNGRKEEVDESFKRSDLFFATDGDYSKAINLHQGVGYDCRGGQVVEAPEIAFTGSIYGERGEWHKKLKDIYGDRYEAFNDKHGRDLNDLCVSTKVMVSPQYPQTDKFWSNRVYNTLGRGGFLIHPYCKDILKEFKDGKNIVLYKDFDDMVKKIDYYLENDEEREKIRIAGRDLVRSKYTYKDRVKTICKRLEKEN